MAQAQDKQEVVRLDGQSLTRAQVVAVGNGANVELDEAQLVHVQRAADFLRDMVARQEPIYGVSTGFGSNADKLLGAHRLRSGPDVHGSVLEELQRNLVGSSRVDLQACKLEYSIVSPK